MSNAQKLVNEAAENTILQWESLISQLQEEEGITNDKAREEIARAFIVWRNNRPSTVIETVLKSIIEGTGKPKREELEFTDRD